MDVGAKLATTIAEDVRESEECVSVMVTKVGVIVDVDGCARAISVTESIPRDQGVHYGCGG